MSESQNNEDVMALFEEIEAYINDASSKLENGQYVELSDLNKKVEDLCQRILQQPQAIGAMHADALEQLSDKLTTLKAGMEKAKSYLVKETNDLQQRKKAAKSYRPTTKPTT